MKGGPPGYTQGYKTSIKGSDRVMGFWFPSRFRVLGLSIEVCGLGGKYNGNYCVEGMSRENSRG